MTPGDPNQTLPRTVPSDPSVAADERAVRTRVEEMTRERNIAMARAQAARLGRPQDDDDPVGGLEGGRPVEPDEIRRIIEAAEAGDCHGFEPPSDEDILGGMGIKEVEVMRVRPGDVIVLHSDYRIPRAGFLRIKALMTERFPDNEIILFEKGLRVSVARAEDAA